MPLGDIRDYIPGLKTGIKKSLPTTLHGALTVGYDTVGHDVKFFGTTTGKYFLWDESADGVVLVGSMTQTGNAQFTGTVTVGADDTGYDVKFYGATSGKYFLWDESADTAIINGVAQIGATAVTALALGGGASATPMTTANADKNFVGFYTQSTATSGDSRGAYFKHNLGGTIAATGYGDGVRAFTTVGGTGYSYASGLHGTMSISVGGTVTGAGSGIRATLGAAAATRTLTGALSALHLCSDIGANNTMPTVHGFIRFTDDSTVRISNLMVTPVANNGTLLAAHTDQAMTHSLKFISEDGTAYYLMATTTATGRS